MLPIGCVTRSRGAAAARVVACPIAGHVGACPRRLAALAAGLLLLALPGALPAQTAVEPAAAALSDWIALDAPTGHEARAAGPLLRALPGWARDPSGNLVLRRGSGRPRRVVACGIDRAGFVVGGITDEGYLRVHGHGGSRHPLWEQAHEGQRIRVLTRTGPVPGVAAIANAHYGRHHRGDTTVVRQDDLWLDVGAESRAEAEALGIRLLDPVVREWTGWSYAGHVAGPGAATRVGCAAVAAASRGAIRDGETVFLLSTLRGFGHDGLAAALARLGAVDQVTLVDGPADGRPGTGPARRRIAASRLLPVTAGVDSVTVLGAPAAFAGTLVESVRIEDADALLDAVAEAAGADRPRGAEPWVRVPGAAAPPAALPADDALGGIAALLARLADLPGVSGHEAPVREAVLAALPAWARARATVESSGTLVLAMGPDRDTVVFVAHLDETGWEVQAIRPDGTVELARRGGMMPSAWEGQPAVLHFDPAPGRPARPPLRGVFVPRDEPDGKQPRRLAAWFGVDSAGLAALGVRAGQSITMPKRASRLAAHRFTARGLDDRAGSTALVLAARELDPERLTRKVIFAWATEEEVGLVGARALAGRLGPTVRRAYSVDTFVSSDTPLESPHFAHAPLGRGAVLRALDNASIAPPQEVDRILGVARREGIPLQVGTTDGGTDGSSFVPYGAAHAGLSWPGRYSHSPAEVLDLRDLASLVRLVKALAAEPERVSAAVGPPAPRSGESP